MSNVFHHHGFMVKGFVIPALRVFLSSPGIFLERKSGGPCDTCTHTDTSLLLGEDQAPPRMIMGRLTGYGTGEGGDSSRPSAFSLLRSFWRSGSPCRWVQPVLCAAAQVWADICRGSLSDHRAAGLLTLVGDHRPNKGTNKSCMFSPRNSICMPMHMWFCLKFQKLHLKNSCLDDYMLCF